MGTWSTVYTIVEISSSSINTLQGTNMIKFFTCPVYNGVWLK